MDNFTKIGMPVLVVLFLLVAAISITITVTKENTLKQIAAVANRPVSSVEAQIASAAPATNYATTAQPVVSNPDQNTVSIPVNDYNNTSGVAQASCHGSGAQGTSTTTGNVGRGCNGGNCRGNAGTLSSATSSSSNGASCH